MSAMRTEGGVRYAKGFTMLEMMVAITIVGILAAIALPAYTSYIQRGRLVEATGELSTLRMRLEQYFQDNRHYGSSATQCAAGAIGTGTGDFFAFTCNWGTIGTNQGFTVTATGTGAMNGFIFTIDQNNTRRTTGFPGAGGLPRECWIYRAGDSC